MKDNLSDAWLEIEDLPSGQRVVYIIDAMVFIQKHKRFGCTTFDELQEMYCKPKYCTVVSFVADRYDFEPSVSLKQEERENWYQSGSSDRKEYEPQDTFEFPDWDLISQNTRNKAILLDYRQFMDEKQCSLANVIGVGKTFEITKFGCTELPTLSCKEHEEAGTRIFAHAAYCVQIYGCNVVVLLAKDTGIFVNAMNSSVRIP